VTKLHLLLLRECPLLECVAPHLAILMDMIFGEEALAPEELLLLPPSEWDKTIAGNKPICDDCRSYMQSQHPVLREEIWDELPLMFGLPDWTQLHRELKERFTAQCEA
jgi:hypothetical protein